MEKLIITEQSNPNSIDIDISSTLKIVEIINNEDKKVAFAIEKEKEKIAEAIDLISKKILKGGSLIYGINSIGSWISSTSNGSFNSSKSIVIARS